eukprot:2761839-Amphidinium_carterae.1
MAWQNRTSQGGLPFSAGGQQYCKENPRVKTAETPMHWQMARWTEMEARQWALGSLLFIQLHCVMALPLTTNVGAEA